MSNQPARGLHLPGGAGGGEWTRETNGPFLDVRTAIQEELQVYKITRHDGRSERFGPALRTERSQEADDFINPFAGWSRVRHRAEA
jgi:hypothetical protein